MKTLKRYFAILTAFALLWATQASYASVTGTIQVTPTVTESATVDNGTSTWVYGSSTPWSNIFTNGTGLNQATKVFQDTATLAGSGSQSYDLDSTLTGPLASVSFTRIYAILIQRTDTPAASTQDENLKIGGDWVLTKYLIPGADTLSATTIPLPPGGTFYILAPNSTGIAVTASTGDDLTITNASSADSCTFKILILGS